MRGAIRLAVCLLVATSTATFAAADDRASPGIDRAEQAPSTTDVTPNETNEYTTDDDAGAGAMEPTSAEPRATDPRSDASSDAAAIEEYNDENFLEQTWKAAP